MNNLISIYRGDYKPISVSFTINGAPMSIVGHTLFFTVKTKISDLDADAKIAKVVTVHTDPGAGQSLIELTATDTSLPIGDYWYDIQLVAPTGEPMTFLRGNLSIMQDITQRTSV